MNKRQKKKHKTHYWLRTWKERKVTWQEFLAEIARQHEMRERQEQDFDKCNNYTTPLEPVKPREYKRVEVVTLEEQEHE